MVEQGYKQTEIGILPEDWEAAPLLEKAELINGLTYTPADIKDYGLLVMRSSNVQDGRFSFDNNVYVDCAVSEERLIKKNDILICVRNGSAALIGKCAKADRDYNAAFGAFMAVLRGDDNDYVFQILLQGTIQKQIAKNSDSTINQITNGDFRQIKIPFPQKERERLRITTALTDADNLIFGLEKLIAKKKAIRQGAMQELLSGSRRLKGFTAAWKPYQIGKIGTFYGGLSGKSKADFGTGNARYITFLNVLNNPVIDTGILEKVRVAENETQNSVAKGDLFFNTSSEIPEEVGMCSALTEDVENTYLNSFCFGFKITESEMDPLYLSYYFNGREGRKIMRVLAQGATRYNLSKAHLSEVTITVPEKKEQTAIARIFSDMDFEIAELEKKSEKYKNIKAGMTGELLTGHIRLTDKEES